MAIAAFYTEVIIITLGAATILYAMAKRCIETIENLESSWSQDVYRIQSHVWVTDIKTAVKEVYSLIQENVSESDSEDTYTELFSSTEKISSLRSRLNQLNRSYNAYVKFRSLLPDLVREHEESKKWMIRVIAICFAFAIWGATGFLMEAEADFFATYTEIFWYFFCLLLVLSAISIYKITYHNRKCGIIKRTIRIEKSKYGDILEKEL